MKKTLLVNLLLVWSLPLSAQVIWNNGAADSLWSSTGNWSTGVLPTGTDNVQIDSQPSSDTLAVDTASIAVGSLTFNSNLTASVDIIDFGGPSIQVNGNITNSDNNQHNFSLQVISGANATYTGGTSGIQFNELSVGTKSITTSGTILISSKIIFDINSASVYGSIGTITFSTATKNIAIGGSYTGSSGDTFDLTTGNFTGATILSLPTLTAGLAWDTTNFLTNGTLLVVPEPHPIALLSLLLPVAHFVRRRRAF